jgi:hypothetical protein
MTSPANEMHIFLWQIGTVIPIRSMITHIYMPRFQAKSLISFDQRLGFVIIYLNQSSERNMRETCKTQHSLIFTGQNPLRWRHNNNIRKGVGSNGVLQKYKIQICHGEYIKRQINILTMKRKAIGSVKSV